MKHMTVGRVTLIACGVGLLGLLGWNVFDGVIYFRGETRRVDHPIWFWVEAVLLAGVAILIIYTALTYKPKDENQT
jgi:4-hydroxybenzoate polyprenyltransferase